jgi:alanine dehydrogenase
MLKAGVFWKSSKKNEKRIPIHPSMFSNIETDLRSHVFFESGYGKDLGLSDDFFFQHFGGAMSRQQLFESTDVWMLPKPTIVDSEYFSEGKILWGWPHCIESSEITQAFVEKKMTAIAWESMRDGHGNLNVFRKNSEIAGYAAVQHMMMAVGKTGYYGDKLSAAVIGFGSTGRGATIALSSLGITDIDIFTRRPAASIDAPVPDSNIGRITTRNNRAEFTIRNKTRKPSEALGKYNVIVNCFQQNPIEPILFVDSDEVQDLVNVTDIVDVSADPGMGFCFAKYTTIDRPVVKVDNTRINYYAVDHAPTLYAEAASLEISKVVLEYLPDIMLGRWRSNPVLAKAADISNGHIHNTAIIKFQGRSNTYPYTLQK